MTAHHSQNAGRGGGSAHILPVWSTWAAGVVALVASFSTAGAEIGLGQFHTYDTPTRVMFRMSSVEIGPTTRQGAVAEVIFHNTNTNGHDDERRKTVTLNGMSVDVVFGFNVNAETHDRITIYPPDGFIAIPDTLTLPEESEGVSYIYPAEVPLG